MGESEFDLLIRRRETLDATLKQKRTQKALTDRAVYDLTRALSELDIEIDNYPVLEE